MSDQKKIYEESLNYHKMGKCGKLEVVATKPLATQYDLALAYSPGVAAPCIAIAENIDKAYEYTSKGNLVAVISNGTAVLGLGDLGALASKPVMEGKAVLFKQFGGVDSIDIEVDTKDVDEFVNAVRLCAKSWGGINLEDIKSPECFDIEDRLKGILDIPVFHDDQHGTAIITAAALINSCEIVGKRLNEVKIAINGAGAAAIACADLLVEIGVEIKNIIMCDRSGVIYHGRESGDMNKWKRKYASSTNARTLKDAINGSDVFLGLSAKGAVSKEMVASMAKNPIIFALANPDPEITPEDVLSVRDDAIIATGRSDYLNQVNNVLCFPYIFRGALDTMSKEINKQMKIAASYAIASIAKLEATDQIKKIYPNKNFAFGKEYILPVPFDSRLLIEVSSAVANAAIKSGVAKKDLNIDLYKKELEKYIRL